jgi:protein-disulfide isomerase
VSKKTWIIFAAVCAVLLGGLVYMSNQGKVDVSKADINSIQAASVQSGNIADHILGKADSKVVLVAYEDFQCPGCGSTYPYIKEVTEKYKDQIAFVFRNFPLAQLHPNARAAAAAAEAAGLQGKYWEMHNKLFETQSSWQNLGSNERTDFFAGYASDLGLNKDTFKTDMTGTAVNQKISYDQAIGKKANINSTPTLYLNGKELSLDAWSSVDKLNQLIVDAMKANGITVPEL